MTSSSATTVGTEIRFPTPPLGLVASQYLLTPVEGTRALFTMRATEEEDLRLFLLEPSEYFPDYLTQVRGSIRKVLGRDLEGVAVFVVLNPGENGERPTANLLAPILVDTAECVGVQTVLDTDDLPLRAPLVTEGK